LEKKEKEKQVAQKPVLNEIYDVIKITNSSNKALPECYQ